MERYGGGVQASESPTERAMLTCREVATLVSDAVEGTLPPTRRVSYWMHLALCGACRRYRAQMNLTRAALRRITDRIPPPEMPTPVREEFTRLKKEWTPC